MSSPRVSQDEFYQRLVKADLIFKCVKEYKKKIKDIFSISEIEFFNLYKSFLTKQFIEGDEERALLEEFQQNLDGLNNLEAYISIPTKLNFKDFLSLVKTAKIELTEHLTQLIRSLIAFEALQIEGKDKFLVLIDIFNEIPLNVVINDYPSLLHRLDTVVVNAIQNISKEQNIIRLPGKSDLAKQEIAKQEIAIQEIARQKEGIQLSTELINLAEQCIEEIKEQLSLADKNFSKANLSLDNFIIKHSLFKKSFEHSSDIDEITEKLIKFITASKIDILCISANLHGKEEIIKSLNEESIDPEKNVELREDLEAYNTALLKRKKFLTKGLSIIILNDEKVNLLVAKLATRITSICHWSAANGSNLFAESRKNVLDLAIEIKDENKFSRLDRFTVLGCSTALPPPVHDAKLYLGLGYPNAGHPILEEIKDEKECPTFLLSFDLDNKKSVLYAADHTAPSKMKLNNLKEFPLSESQIKLVKSYDNIKVNSIYKWKGSDLKDKNINGIISIIHQIIYEKTQLYLINKVYYNLYLSSSNKALLNKPKQEALTAADKQELKELILNYRNVTFFEPKKGPRNLAENAGDIINTDRVKKIMVKGYSIAVTPSSIKDNLMMLPSANITSSTILDNNNLKFKSVTYTYKK